MLVKLKSAEGVDIFVNPDHVAIVAPNGDMIGQSKTVLVNGISIAILESVRDVARKFGWEEPSCLTT